MFSFFTSSRILQTPPKAEDELSFWDYLMASLIRRYAAPGYNNSLKILYGRKTHFKAGNVENNKPSGEKVMEQFRNAPPSVQMRYLALCAIQWPGKPKTGFEGFPDLQNSFGGTTIETFPLLYLVRLPKVLLFGLPKATLGLIFQSLEIAMTKLAFRANRESEEITAGGWISAAFYGLFNLSDMLLKCATDPITSYRKASEKHHLLGALSGLVSFAELCLPLLIFTPPTVFLSLGGGILLTEGVTALSVEYNNCAGYEEEDQVEIQGPGEEKSSTDQRVARQLRMAQARAQQRAAQHAGGGSVQDARQGSYRPDSALAADAASVDADAAAAALEAAVGIGRLPSVAASDSSFGPYAPADQDMAAESELTQSVRRLG